MRLINIKTGKLEQFVSTEIPDYAIFSHTWDEEEVTFADFQSGSFQSLKGYRKIEYVAQQAAHDKLGYFWVDTCCIDKSSSAELSEAINSMFRWYRDSAVCYTYLSDVDLEDAHDTFAMARWFTRGWTLQELLAPTTVRFYSKHWAFLGTQTSLRDAIADITGIEKAILVRESHLFDQPVATRMSWAAKRNTTREEDVAYCLLGLFDINMPLLYGEGSKAFLRLQEEILKVSSDHTLFLWSFSDFSTGNITWPNGLRYHFRTRSETLVDAEEDSIDFFLEDHASSDNLQSNFRTLVDDHTDGYAGPFAASPHDFLRSAGLSAVGTTASLPSMTSNGLQIRLPVVDINALIDFTSGLGRTFVALTSGQSAQMPHHLIGMLLREEVSAGTCSRVFLANGCASFPVPPAVATRAELKDLCILGHHTANLHSLKSMTDQHISLMVDVESITGIGYSLAFVEVEHGRWSPADQTVYFGTGDADAVSQSFGHLGYTAVVGLVHFTDTSPITVMVNTGTVVHPAGLRNAPKSSAFFKPGKAWWPRLDDFLPELRFPWTAAKVDQQNLYISARISRQSLFHSQICKLRFTLEIS